MDSAKPVFEARVDAVNDTFLPDIATRKAQSWPKTIRQASFIWLIASITLIFFVITAEYALTSNLGKGIAWVHSSPSRTILLLRLISEVTSICLCLLISSVLDRLQWVLITRKGGLDVPTLLCLEAGTGVLGLVQLAILGGFQFVTRVSSAVRLLLKLIIPALSVLIMSQYLIYPV